MWLGSDIINRLGLVFKRSWIVGNNAVATFFKASFLWLAYWQIPHASLWTVGRSQIIWIERSQNLLATVLITVPPAETLYLQSHVDCHKKPKENNKKKHDISWSWARSMFTSISQVIYLVKYLWTQICRLTSEVNLHMCTRITIPAKEC